MAEVAVNIPFDANEVKDMICEEMRKRLNGLGPLMGGKEYASFDATFQVTIKLRRAGDVTAPKDTLAWGSASRGETSLDDEVSAINSTFNSGDPNEERVARGMPLTVETKDGRGNISRRKVNVKQ